MSLVRGDVGAQVVERGAKLGCRESVQPAHPCDGQEAHRHPQQVRMLLKGLVSRWGDQACCRLYTHYDISLLVGYQRNTW